ncbi:MAG: hypothetical protein ACLS3M_01645 [Collinsella sp.]
MATAAFRLKEPWRGWQHDFDALLDRVEAGIASAAQLEAGNVAAIDPTSTQARARAARITTKERL